MIINANNLKKAGFVDDNSPGPYKEYYMDCRSYDDQNGPTRILVSEKGGVIGEAYLELPYDSIPLNLTTVTELLTLAKLLK